MVNSNGKMLRLQFWNLNRENYPRFSLLAVVKNQNFNPMDCKCFRPKKQNHT